VREIGRATQGVRLIRLEENDRVVAVAKIVAEESDSASEAGEGPAGVSESGPPEQPEA
jgi:DNA gyrase subunit A